MERVIIIGCPGSGKSTFGRELKRITGLPLYHLDMMFWNVDKTTVSKEVFIERLQEVMSSLASNWYVLFFYFLNFIMVFIDFLLYFRNRKLDKKQKNNI
ncbi:MAG: hypothetical protein IKL05_02285 [Clostridia bacterium]|nr:hypothetical protein [Clostridia bacterium]